MDSSTPSDEVVGFKVLEYATSIATQMLGKRVCACYALGSLAHGGFSLRASDIDFAIILQGPLLADDETTIQKLKQTVSSGVEYGEKLSIFWSNLSALKTGQLSGRFPMHDRLDLLQYGKKLQGVCIKEYILPPTKKQLLIDSTEFALNRLYTPNVLQAIKHPKELFERDMHLLVKIILLPIRFIYTAQTGQVGVHKAALKHYLACTNQDKAALVQAAYQWRYGQVMNQDNLSYLPDIYLEFLQIYHTKMLEYHETTLAHKLMQWQAQVIN